MVSLVLVCQKQSNFYAIAVATRWMPLTVHVGQAGRHPSLFPAKMTAFQQHQRLMIL
jgi:hypothetical protein